MIHVAEVLEKISIKVHDFGGSELQEFLEKMEEEVSQAYTNSDYVYAQLAELKTLGYTALQLFRETDDDCIHPRGDDWGRESLKPFLETLSTRLPALEQTFYRLVFDKNYRLEWDGTDEPKPTPEEQEKREREFNAAWFNKCVTEIIKLRPEIEEPLNELVGKTQPETEAEQTAEDTSGTKEPE
jgi:hypothetical protein